jgi:hypothetical protein
VIEKSFSLGWLESQRGFEQLRRQCWLINHSSPSRNAPIAELERALLPRCLHCMATLRKLTEEACSIREEVRFEESGTVSAFRGERSLANPSIRGLLQVLLSLYQSGFSESGFACDAGRRSII